jgi:hypothetical protein
MKFQHEMLIFHSYRKAEYDKLKLSAALDVLSQFGIASLRRFYFTAV